MPPNTSRPVELDSHCSFPNAEGEFLVPLPAPSSELRSLVREPLLLKSFSSFLASLQEAVPILMCLCRVPLFSPGLLHPFLCCIINQFIFILYVGLSVWLACLSVHHGSACCLWRPEGILGLELQMSVTHHVGAGN